MSNGIKYFSEAIVTADDKDNGDKDVRDELYFGEDVNNEHCDGEIEDEFSVGEDIDDERCGGEDVDDTANVGKVPIGKDAGGVESIDDDNDRDSVCEDDGNDLEVLSNEQ
jgi:hypothetical protein